MEPARLNPEFIKKPETCLEDLKPGESGWVFWNEMAVDAECRCYIDPKAQLTQLTLSMICVSRSDAGFEVLIPASLLAPLRWKLGAYNPEADKDYARYVPVVKLEYAKTEDRHTETEDRRTESEKRDESIERNLAITEQTNREIAELQKEVDRMLRKLREEGEEGGK